MAHADVSRVLRSHGITVEGSALESAFGDAEQGPAFHEWSRRCLTTDTFISADEHDL